jgi:hypothetical protein
VDFADKLLAGTLPKVSTKVSWWPRHVRMLESYFQQVSSGKESLVKIKEMASRSCVEWDLSLPSSARQRQMERHVSLEMMMVEAALRDDGKIVEQLGDLLIENIVEQSLVLYEAIPLFPKTTFQNLMREHVLYFCTSVRCAIRKTDPCAREIRTNTLRLATLTAEWI